MGYSGICICLEFGSGRHVRATGRGKRPSMAAIQGCRARLPGKAAGQGCNLFMGIFYEYCNLCTILINECPQQEQEQEQEQQSNGIFIVIHLGLI
jgi:hypothetical protein